MAHSRWSLVFGLSLALGCGRDDGAQNDPDGMDDDDGIAPETVPHEGDTSASTETPSESSEEGTTSSDETATKMPCDTVYIDLAQEPARVLLVLDKSGSMKIEWDHDADPGTSAIMRWDSLVSVVEAISTRFNATIDFGAQLFPAAGAQATLTPGACIVEQAPEVGIAPMNSAAILAELAKHSSSTILGGTPAASGMASGIAHLLTLPAKDVPTSIVLITDGAANCDLTPVECTQDGLDSDTCKHEMFEVYDEHLEPIVAGALADHGIATYVVGIDIEDAFIVKPGNPEVNPHDALNDVALAGGKPRTDPDERFYNAINEDQLQAALDEIAGELRTCAIDLTVPPNRPPALDQVPYVSFQLGGGDVPFLAGAASCDGLDGWRWAQPDGPYDAVELCGTWCDTLKVEAEIDGEYGCAPID